jgi:hypothetical protein
MHTSFTWFRWIVLAGFLFTNFLALPGIFVPGAVLDLLGLRLATQPIWPAFAFLLMFLVSWFYVPAALDPLRFWTTAILSVASRFAYAGFWLLLYPRFTDAGAPWIAFVELLLGGLQLILLVQVSRESLTQGTAV